MSHKDIHALDLDLEQFRNAFLRALEAQGHLDSNTPDVNPDLPGDVPHAPEANKSHSDSITHDVNPDLRGDAPHALGATQSSEQTI